MTDTPRIYVASLSDYNAGTLHGVWIDADSDADTISDEITAMLSESTEDNAEEYAIHDFEGFGEYRIGEFESLSDVSELGQGIAKHGLAYAAYCANLGQIVESGDFEEAYYGEYDSVTDYAREYVEDSGILSNSADFISQYFDYEAYGRDLAHDMMMLDNPNGGIWVFQNV